MEDMDIIGLDKTLEDVFSESSNPIESGVGEIIQKLLETERMNTDYQSRREAVVLSLLEAYCEMCGYENLKNFIQYYRENVVSIKRQGRKEVVELIKLLGFKEKRKSLLERLRGD